MYELSTWVRFASTANRPQSNSINLSFRSRNKRQTQMDLVYERERERTCGVCVYECEWDDPG